MLVCLFHNLACTSTEEKIQELSLIIEIGIWHLDDVFVP